MDIVWLTAGMAVAGYVLGAIPFGLVVSKVLGTVDPRVAGSHNVGFTNVLRVAGKTAGILTLIGDMGKGWVVGVAATQVLVREEVVLLVALCPILGHLHSIFLNFRGGKGVATALGVVLGVAPTVGMFAIAVWLITVAVWRYSSGGALMAFGLLPFIAAGLQRSVAFGLFVCLVSALIWFRHKENLGRLWNGTESRIGHAS
ncbi:MAG: glycerol-3-phosphate 1-O-acyltransferase PlsY [Nitrospiraceae bacterium]